MEKGKTFAELYDDAVRQPLPPSPRMEFIRKIQDITGKAQITIESWAKGRRQPDISSCMAIGKALGIDWHVLFPDKVKKKE